jgi:hypothetical protein
MAKTYLSISVNQKTPALTQAKNVEVTVFDGPHPAGNVGVQINRHVYSVPEPQPTHCNPASCSCSCNSVPCHYKFYARMLRLSVTTHQNACNGS